MTYKETPAQLVDATLAVLAALLVGFVMTAIWQLADGAHPAPRDVTVATAPDAVPVIAHIEEEP